MRWPARFLELERSRDQVDTAKPGMIEEDTSFRIISDTEALIAELERAAARQPSS
ncbi:MAG: hypothetical protein ACLFWH_06495 [Actinomycetota bacterium]